MKRLVRISAVSVLVISSLTSVGAPPASAMAGTLLPLTNFYGMVVDGAQDHVFVTGGNGNDKVLVLDYEGNILTSIYVPGASGMTLVGTTLYVAAYGGASIDTIDTTTNPPTKSGTVPIGSYTQPQEIAYAGGRLWFTAIVAGGSTRTVAVVNTNGTGLQAAGSFKGDRFRTDPTDPNVLMSFSFGSSGVYKYDASTLPATLVRSSAYLGSASNQKDLEVLPDGTKFTLASGAPYEFPEFRTSDFGAMQTYAASPYPVAVAATSTGGGRLAGGVMGLYEPDVWVYDIGYAQPTWTFDWGTTDVTMFNAGLEWSDDGTRLFAIGGNATGHVVRFYVFNPSPAVTLSLDVAGGGVVGTSPSGISCPPTCSADFPGDATVNIYASPDIGQSFTGWAGACSGTDTWCQVEMTSALSATATFADVTAPNTFIDISPADPSGSSVVFGYSASEAGSTFECDLDGGGFGACGAGGKSYNGLSSGSHTFQVRATDAATNTDATPASFTWTVTAGPAPYQPDEMIRPSSSFTDLGNNIYNTTGIGQATALTVTIGSTAKYYVKLQNDGTRSDAFKVKGCSATPGFTVTYKVGRPDVTPQVLAGTYKTASLPVGSYGTMAVKVKASTPLASSQTLTCAITATSVGDGTKTDVVSAATTGG